MEQRSSQLHPHRGWLQLTGGSQAQTQVPHFPPGTPPLYELDRSPLPVCMTAANWLENKCTSARIVFYLNLVVRRYFLVLFRGKPDIAETWWDQIGGFRCTKERLTSIMHQITLSKFMTILMEHYLQYLWSLMKTRTLRISKISSSASTDGHGRESCLDVKSYFYSSVETLAWLTMEAWANSAALMTNLEMWNIQVTNSRGCVESRTLGSIAMHRMHMYFLKTGKIRILS